MSGKLQQEIKQARPFASSEQEALLNVWRTADHLNRAVVEVLKRHGLSPTQYNVLRILRGAGDEGLACQEIGERLVTRDPDITRLLDRLESRDLITRHRQTKDRRVVCTRITDEGLALLKQLDGPMGEGVKKLFAHMKESQLRQLIELLESAREGG